MTMQVAMIGSNGIVLASDMKWVTRLDADWRGPKRHHHFESKIRIDKDIAICCAGDMIDSPQLADEILSHLREGKGDEMQRIREIVTPTRVDEREIECIVAFAPPNKKLIHIHNVLVRSETETEPEWGLSVRHVRGGVQTAGDQANDAKFWLRYYDPSLSVQELKGLAVHLVVEAQNFNNAMIGGLEVVLSGPSGFYPLSEAECQNLEADAKSRARHIGELIFRPPTHN